MSDSKTTIEAVAHYQRMGDGTGLDWAQLVLNHAEERGYILPGYAVLGEWQLSWVQVVVFTYQFEVLGPRDGLPWDYVVALANNLAEAIVGESDVDVLGVKMVE